MRVLIAIDGSKCSEAAFDSVLHRQWLPVDQFRIVSVVELIIGQYPLAMSYGNAIVEAQHELITGGQELVGGKMAQLQSKLPENQVTGQAIEGFAAEAILAESKNMAG